MVVLSEGIGYVILLGIGLVMALAVTLLVRAETKWLGTKKTFEWFSTAGRSVKTGLIASSVVSAWTWAATLLQSSTVAYQFGISGPFWYAAGASIQVILFAILAMELKRKSPSSHTFPEMIYARFGKLSHKVFLFFALMTNTIVTAMLVLGGAAVVNSLTGVNIYVAAFLIPVGVIIYTFFGGLKATFLAEYLNTVFLFTVVLIFVIAVYFLNPHIGGISGMFDKLTHVAITKPVEGNFAGSYLTMASFGSLVFGIINIVGNFGTVFVDQAHWQRAIAAAPKSAFKGFMIGGLAWFAIPFTLATTLGLAAVAIGVPLTSEQIGMGLVAPTAASQVLGDFGAILLLTMLFTAVTAAGSAELISVSSLITYDVYRTYFNPSATGRGLMRISRLAIVSFGIGMGLLAVILLQVGASLQYVYLTMGVLIGSAVVPISLAIVWKRTNKVAATAGALVGLVCGVAVWLSFSYAFYGTVSVSTTSQSLPLLAGNVTSILVGGIVTLFGSMVRPDNFDFRLMKQKIKIVDAKIRRAIEQESDEEYLKRWSKFGYKFGIALTLTLVIAWPIPLYISGYVFSKDAYIVWVGIAVSWAATAATVIVLLPLVESRVGIVKVLNRISQASVVEQVTERNALYPAPDSEGEQQKRILVPVDGSHQSLRALDYAASIYNRGSSIHHDKVMIIILNVIEWVDEDDESMDEDLTAAMEEQGRRMLRSIIIPKSARDYERMVKLGDPATKIVEMAEKLKVDMIVMGATGLSNSEEIGHVSRKVLKMTTSIPVMFTK
ncbi:MAG: sodium/solute symporter [Thermoproteota archaeon]|nr:sodium/solute symporter [Thermoproteota archaeon]